MTKLVGIVGSAVASGRTLKAVRCACEEAVKQRDNLNYQIIDVSKSKVSILDGRPAEEYEDDTAEVLSVVDGGDMFIMGSPIYRGTYTGAFKNLLDHCPLESLEGKTVGLIATGASPHHYLSIDHEMRAVFGWFSAHVVPGSVYVHDADYQDGSLTERISDYLRSLGRAVVECSEAMEGIHQGPPSLMWQLKGQ